MQTRTRLGVASALACCITTAAAVTNANASTPHPTPPTPHSIAATAVHPIAAHPGPPPSGQAQADYMRAYDAWQGQVTSVEGSGAAVGAVIGVPVGCALGSLFGLPFAAAGPAFPPLLIVAIPSSLAIIGSTCVMGGLAGATFGTFASEVANLIGKALGPVMASFAMTGA